MFYPHFVSTRALSVPQAAQVGQLLGKRALYPENNKLLDRAFDNIT